MRIYTVVGVALGMFLGALDQTIVSTALPRIVDHLSGLDRYTWVATIYLLISTILVPIYGKLSDLISRKTLQLWSVSIFLLGSFLCGLSGEFGSLPILGDGMTQLIVFRGIQAIGGAGIFALAFIIVADLYPPRERGKVAGVFGSVFGLASVVGPLVGGFLTDNAGSWIPGIDGWRWIFYVNLPLGALALGFIGARMPVLAPHDDSRKLNIVSAILMLCSFVPIILALQLDKTLYPWTSPTTLALLLGGVALLALWVGHTGYAKHPILDLRLFANKVFLRTNLATFFFGAGFIAVIIFLPLYMVNVQGVSATSAGASVIPLMLGMVGSAGLSGFLVTRLGKYKALMVAGACIAVAAAILMALVLGTNTPYWSVVVLMVFVGMGFGPAQSLYSLAVQNAVPPQEIGQATSTNQFVRQIGSTVGAAVVGSIFTVVLSTAMAANLPATGARPGQPAAERPAVARVESRGLSEIRADIEAGFDRRGASIEKLFALRGAEAKAALGALEADPTIPAELRDKLAAGTPAMAIDAAFARLDDGLEKAIVAGDADAVGSILAASGAAPQVGAFIGADRSESLVRLARAPVTARVAALPGIRGGLATASDAAVAAANASALAPIRAAFAKAKTEAADAAVAGIRKAFSDSIHRIWLISIIVMLTMAAFTLFIPSLPLRSRKDMAAAAREADRDGGGAGAEEGPGTGYDCAEPGLAGCAEAGAF